MNLVELAQGENIRMLVQAIRNEPNAEELFEAQIRKLTAVIHNKNQKIKSLERVNENLLKQLQIREA